MHLPPPSLPRFGGGERPPFLCKPIAPLTITMGQRLGSLQALTPRERCSRFPPARPSGPLSRIGKGGGGKGRCACGYLWSVSVRSTDLDFSWEKNLNPYPALQATGVLGQRPKRVLVPFTRVKGTPRRRAVQIRITKNLSPPKVSTGCYLKIRRRREETASCPSTEGEKKLLPKSPAGGGN